MTPLLLSSDLRHVKVHSFIIIIIIIISLDLTSHFYLFFLRSCFTLNGLLCADVLLRNYSLTHWYKMLVLCTDRQTDRQTDRHMHRRQCMVWRGFFVSLFKNNISVMFLSVTADSYCGIFSGHDCSKNWSA